MPLQALARNPLFEQLDPAALATVEAAMRRRSFAAGEELCRAGEPGDSLFVVLDGFARVTLGVEGGEEREVAVLRRGDVVGEMSLLTDEPRNATVVAAVPTTALQLGRDEFAALVAREPRMLEGLTRVLSEKLAATTARVADVRTRGEAIAVLVAGEAAEIVPGLLAAIHAASARPVAELDVRDSPEALAGLDDLLSEHGTVVVVADAGEELAPAVVEGMDRVVAIGANAGQLGGVRNRPVETIELAPGRPPDLAFLGRRLSRTTLGLALGAGGAKGFAHVGVLAVLEEAGYTVDYVSGSSIGAIVAACIALGQDAAAAEAAMRTAFSPAVVEEVFKLSMAGGSTGLETLTRVLREMTGDRTFADLERPLVVMAVDLNSRRPYPIIEGPLWEALLAATALAGMFPPHEQNGLRLVDGLALVPVPSDAVRTAGADLAVSVNLIGRETLPSWPGEQQPPEAPKRSGRVRMLDTLLEVMDVSQLDSSERHAARADVAITPRFGPATWRDFHLADLFLEAGRRAAQAQLPALRALAAPQGSSRVS